MEQKPAITIILTAFNYGNLISRAIESVLNQTFENFELLIIDDASPDETFSEVQKFNDKRLRYFKNPTNLGASGSWNVGAQMAKGEFVCVLCADDTLPANSLEIRLNKLLATGKDIVHTGLSRLIEATGREEYVEPYDTSTSQRV